MADFTGGDDPIVKELLPGYLARRREELTTLDEAIEHRDFAKLRMIGHNLRGSGGAYGLDRVSEFGTSLETAAKTQDDNAVRDTIRQMRAYLKEIAL